MPLTKAGNGLGAAPRDSAVSAGLALALGAAAISGVSVWLNGYGVKQVPDPAVYTTLKNLVAAAILGVLMVTGRDTLPVRRIGRHRWPIVVAVAVIGGSLPFVLFFTGLAHATAPGAAFIQKTLFVWVALLAVPLLGERIGVAQIGAMGALLIGQLLLVPPNLAGAGWTDAETMIAGATVLWAIEVVVVKRFLADIPATAMGALRLGIGGVILVGYLLVTGSLAGIATVSAQGWFWVAVTGTFLAAYVAAWFGALRRAPASAVSSVLVGGALVTAILQAISNGTTSVAPLLAGSAALLFGAVVVVARTTRQVRPTAAAAG